MKLVVTLLCVLGFAVACSQTPAASTPPTIRFQTLSTSAVSVAIATNTNTNSFSAWAILKYADFDSTATLSTAVSISAGTYALVYRYKIGGTWAPWYQSGTSISNYTFVSNTSYTVIQNNNSSGVCTMSVSTY